MGIMHGAKRPDLNQKFSIIEMQVKQEFRKELKTAGFFKKPFVKWKIQKEIKRRQQDIYSDYVV